MLKNLQKVRDVLEEVTHVYAETTVLGNALAEEGWLRELIEADNEAILALTFI